MKNKRKIIIGIILLFLMIFCGIFSYFKITYSYFGENLTGQLGTLRIISYYSNYPSDSTDGKRYLDSGKVNFDYVIKDIMFEVPNKYEFSHWNTKSDDSGIKYNVNDSFELTEEIDLYAIWKKAKTYGDINLDGVVNNDDLTLLDKYVLENTILTEDILSNADVNVDGKIDSVDVDIIKQAVLGTKGYEGLLTNKPVLIYDIYEGTLNNGDNNNSGSSTNNNSNGGSTTGNGKPSNNNGGSSNNSGGNTSSNTNIGENNSTNNNEEDNVLETEDIIVDNNKIDEDRDKIENKSYVWIFISLILLITLRFVVLIIKKMIQIKNENK